MEELANKSMQALQDALEMCVSLIAERSISPKLRRRVAMLLASILRVICLFKVGVPNGIRESIPESYAAGTAAKENLILARQKCYGLMKHDGLLPVEYYRIAEEIINITVAIERLKPIMSRLRFLAYKKDIMVCDTEFYKCRYALILYHDEDEVIGVFSNVRELSKRLGIPLPSLRKSVTLIYQKKRKSIECEGERLRIGFVDMIENK